MHFQINTPQTVGADIAIKESRKASKRMAAQNSDIEPSTKKQKLLHPSVSLTPAPAPAPTYFQTHATTPFEPTPELPKLTNTSLPPVRAQSQNQNTIDLGAASAATKKRKPDDSSVDLTTFQDIGYESMHPARAAIQNVADPEPATKKQKISYANLPAARVRKKGPSEESDRVDPRNLRKRLEGECRRHGHDHHVLDKIPDEILTSDNFDIFKHLLTIGSNNQSTAYGAPQLDVYPFSGSSAERSKAETPEIDTRHAPNQDNHDPSYRPKSLNTATQVHPVSGQVFLHHTPASSQINRERLDSTPLSPGSILTDSTILASSSRTPSVSSPCNRGGRPRGRKPPAAKIPKTPKGPTRLQKNHPVKAAVNVDVWENILSFCPPDFLLKAREVSSTFRSMLRANSPIWKMSRVRHFGHDMPDPPSGLSEPQYADLLTRTGCQARGCEDTKARKTYWAFQKRLCLECFQEAFLPPRALRRVFKELETSAVPQYRSIAQYYQNMEDFLPGMKFDRWNNYQWLGDYDPTPSWGQLYRSGQYVAFPASAYATFSSELAELVGNEYDVEQGRFSSSKPMHEKTCPPQDTVDAWFDRKRAINDALVPELQAVENWCETYKRNNQRVGKDHRKSRESFYEEQAELAGLDKSDLGCYESYQAAIAISRPATMQSWKILLPKILAERENAKSLMAGREAVRAAEAMRIFERDVEREMEAADWTAEEPTEGFEGYTGYYE